MCCAGTTDAGAGTADGTPLQLATCNGNAAQQVVLNAAGDLVNPMPNKCVDIAAWNPNNAAPLHLWTCVGGANQKWRRIRRVRPDQPGPHRWAGLIPVETSGCVLTPPSHLSDSRDTPEP